MAGISCTPPSYNGIVIDPPADAPPFRLADSTGAVFDLAAQRGKVVLVFFGYTHCPDVCPTTLLEWKKAAAALGGDADKVRFVFVSVDPERDTPAIAQRYAARFSPTFAGLTGSRAQIDSLMGNWKVTAFREGVPSDSNTSYTVSHPSLTYVLDGAGQLRLLHRPGLTPAQISSDIRELL